MKNGNIFPVKNRLKELRNEKKLTQTELQQTLENMGCSLTLRTLRNYEKGGVIPSDVLICLSDLFECSIDYLLGRSDCRTVNNALIRQETGLSDDAINKLHLLRDWRNNLPVATINQLLKTVVPVPPALNDFPVKGVDDALQLIGLYLSGGDLQADDTPVKTGFGYAVTLDGGLLASGGILNLINLRLTEYRAGITKQKQKSRQA